MYKRQAVGSVVALEFACPLVFARKSKTKNIAGDVYKTQVASFTHGTTYDAVSYTHLVQIGEPN